MIMPPPRSNACFRQLNPKGNNCQGLPTFNIPVDQPWEDIKEGQASCAFRVHYFKYGPSDQSDFYIVVYNHLFHSWTCTCPYFRMYHCAVGKKCCKHIQSCIDKNNKKGPAEYIQFMEEHIEEVI